MAIEPRQRITGALSALLTTADPPLSAHALGVDDERAASGPLPSNVLVYGKHLLLPPDQQADSCARCLARRWQAVRPPEIREALETGGETGVAGDWPYATPFVADALTALRAAADGERAAGEQADQRGDDRVYALNAETLRVEHVRLVADIDCERCGRVEDDRAEHWTLPPTVKPTPTEFRTRAAGDYPISTRELVNPVCGPLGATLWPDLTSVSTAPVHGVFHPRSDDYLREMLFGGHADSFADSTRLGLLEGLERSSGLRPSGKRTTVVAAFDDLGDAAVDPRVCGLYSDRFHRAHPHIDRFAPDRPIAWVWGWSLRDRRPVLVPELLVYYHHVPVRERFVQENSSGCASGGTLVEAVHHGLMEAIERDAFVLAWYTRRSLPEIDPDTSSRRQTRLMVDRLAMYGYRARIFDAGSTFGVPVVTGVAERLDGGFGTLAFGGGAGLNPESAIAAALCEIASDAVKVGIRARADLPRLRTMVEDFDLVWGLHDHPLLYGLPQMRHHADFLLDSGAPTRSVAETYQDLPQRFPPTDDLRDDLQRCVDAVAGQGFDVIAVDQTMPQQRDLGLHTATVLAPGLLPIDFGWLRQRALTMPRLRTALRSAGLADHDLRDEEIHPVPHPYP